MRKLLFIAVFCLSSLLLWRVYATTSSVPSLWTVRLTAAHGLMAGDAVEEGGRRIGQVVRVEPHLAPDRETETDVLITLDPSARDRVRERSTFFVATPTGSTRPTLSLVVFDEKSAVLPPGSQIAGAESETELELKRQLASVDTAIRGVSQQLDQFRQLLDKASKSEEKRNLEKSVEGFFVTMQRTRDDFVRIVTEEVARWKRLYEKFFPPETTRTV
jgi:ABC-type transporter Mla subunit MlaD